MIFFLRSNPVFLRVESLWVSGPGSNCSGNWLVVGSVAGVNCVWVQWRICGSIRGCTCWYHLHLCGLAWRNNISTVACLAAAINTPDTNGYHDDNPDYYSNYGSNRQSGDWRIVCKTVTINAPRTLITAVGSTVTTVITIITIGIIRAIVIAFFIASCYTSEKA